LTLYTLWNLQQLDAQVVFRRQLERHDMATLTAIGTHKPTDLVVVRDRFLDAYLPITRAEQKARERAVWVARAMKHIEAHKHMVPIPPPER